MVELEEIFDRFQKDMNDWNVDKDFDCTGFTEMLLEKYSAFELAFVLTMAVGGRLNRLYIPKPEEDYRLCYHQ